MKINENWEKLIKYRQIKEPRLKKYNTIGASLDEIEQLEKNISVELPNSFRQSLIISNGEINVSKNDGDLTTWLGDWNKLLNCNEIFKETFEYREIFNKGVWWDEVYGIKNIPNEWPDKFVIIVHNDSDVYTILDMREGEYKGQILIVDIEAGILSYWAESYDVWLAEVVDEVLKYNELRLETIENILQIPEE